MLRQRGWGDHGFTAVEMLVIAPIVLVTIGAFVAAAVTLTGNAVETRSQNMIAADVQTALNQIGNDVADSTKILATNDFTVQANQGSDNSTAAFNNDPTTIILKLPLTNTNPRSASGNTDNYVYLANRPNPCSSSNVTSNMVATYDVVYFLKNNVLWRRVMMPANYNSTSVNCSTPWQRPTCFAGVSGAYCATTDSRVIANVTSYTIQYLNGVNSIPDTVNTTSDFNARQSLLNDATAINVSIGAQLNSTTSDSNYAFQTSKILSVN